MLLISVSAKVYQLKSHSGATGAIDSLAEKKKELDAAWEDTS